MNNEQQKLKNIVELAINKFNDKDTYLLADLGTCQHFLDDYYISGSTSIKIETKPENEVNVDVKFSTIVKVCNALNISIKDFFDDEIFKLDNLDVE